MVARLPRLPVLARLNVLARLARRTRRTRRTRLSVLGVLAVRTRLVGLARLNVLAVRTWLPRLNVLAVRHRLTRVHGPAVRIRLPRLALLAVRTRLPGQHALYRLALRSPGSSPWLAARRSHLFVGDARYPGLTSVGGQHDAFVRGAHSRQLLSVTLSALRHRNSYVWTYGTVGSRYRVTPALRTRVWKR